MRPKIGHIYYYTSRLDKDIEELFLVTSKQRWADWLYYVQPLASNGRGKELPYRINIYMKHRKWKEVTIEELPLYVGLKIITRDFTELIRGDNCYASRFMVGHNRQYAQRAVACNI